MIYLLIVNIALLISFGLYHLCFRKLTFFQWNRLYLLSAVVLALLIPVGLFIDLSSFMQEETILPTIYLGEMMEIPVMTISAHSRPIFLMDVIRPIYYSGLLISLIILCHRFIQLRKAFLIKDSFMSFSFFHKVFLGVEVRDNSVIQSHEQVHVDQGHSYDVILMELVKVVNWFNPVVYWMAKELKFQHECIADEICSEDRVAYAELLVANAMRVDKGTLIHEFSNHSFLKKRIMMLFKNKSSNHKKVFYLSAIPMLCVIVGSTLVFNTTKAKDIVTEVESNFLDVALPIKTEAIANTSAANQVIPEVLVAEELENFILQDTSKKKSGIKEGGEDIFETVEVLPEPPGGMAAFRRWIGDNYPYPQAAIDAEVKGTIQITYVVEKDGSLSDVKFLKDLGYGTGESAVKMLAKSPKWSPGIQNGKKVRVAYNLPIRLHIEKQGGEDSQVEKEVLRSNKGNHSEDMVFKTTEVMPEPPGGMAVLREYLNSHLTYPKGLDKLESASFVVDFIVNKEGRVTKQSSGAGVKISSGALKEYISFVPAVEEDAYINLEKYGNWMPAVLDGGKIDVKYTLIIRFNKGKIETTLQGGEFIKSSLRSN